MSVRVVTTLHEDGYKLYGRYNMRSWSKNFPSDWKIDYYAEKHKPDLDHRFAVLDFDIECSDWQNFYTEVKRRYELENTNDPKRLNWYRKALRWSFKMFVTHKALQNSKERYLIWLDADVSAVKAPEINWIEKCLNSKCLSAQLEHLKAGGHIETGILIFDLHHPDIKKIADWINLGYKQLKVLDEEKAWDGIWMAKLLLSNTVSWNNLQMVIKDRSAAPFSDEKLKWLRHNVGKRKFKNSSISSRSGRTEEKELLKEQL